jgi:hypothetical protein
LAFGSMPSTIFLSSRSFLRPVEIGVRNDRARIVDVREMPGAPVHSISFSASSAAPIAAATVSALMLSSVP